MFFFFLKREPYQPSLSTMAGFGERTKKHPLLQCLQGIDTSLYQLYPFFHMQEFFNAIPIQ